MSYENILNKDISFVSIKSLYESKEQGELLGFYIYVDNKLELNLETYWCVEPIEKAFKILSRIFKKRVPSNYYIFELKNKKVLSKITVSDENATAQMTDVGIHKIEFKMENNSYHSVIHKLLDYNAQVIVDDTTCNLSSLVFNRKNLNISLRYYVDEVGFKTTSIYDILTENLVIKTIQPIENLPYALPSRKTNNFYETNMNFDVIGIYKYSVYVDGVKVDLPNISLLFDAELLIYLANIYFNNQTIVQILGGINNALTDNEEVYSRQSNSRRSSSEVFAEIAPVFKIPSQKEISNLIRKYQANGKIDWDNLKVEVEQSFTPSIVNLVNQVIAMFKDSDTKSTLVSTRVLLSKYNTDCAKAGMVLHGVKASLYSDTFFMKRYQLNYCGGDIYSSVFNTGLKIVSL